MHSYLYSYIDATSEWQVVDIGKLVGDGHRRLVRVYSK